MGLRLGISGNNERDRVQDNLAKAFSLLDDGDAKTPTYGSNPYYAGDQRVGTATSGGAAYGGRDRSNYTGSDQGSNYDNGS